MTREGTDSTGSRLPSPSLGSVVNALALVVLIAVVAPFVVYSMPAVVGADHSFVVLSGSMEPEISPGDVVIVDDATQRQIERGDVITFQQAEAEVPTTHRVIEVNQREDGVAYTTKGDANEDPDPAPVRGSEVIGEVTYVIPLIGYVVRFANTQAGFLLLIGLPLGLLVANEAWSILRAGGDDSGSDDGTGTADGGSPDATTPAVTAASTATDRAADGAPAAETPSTAPAADESDTEATSTYTVTRADLRLSMGILVVFAVYATWVALQDTSGVTVTAAVGSGAGTVICAAIYYAAGGEDDSSPSPTDPGTDVDGDGGGDQEDPDDDDGSAAERVAAEASTDHEHAESAPAEPGDDSPSSIERPAARTSKQTGPDGVTTAGDEAGTTHGSEETNGTGGADESTRTGETPGTAESTDRGEET